MDFEAIWLSLRLAFSTTLILLVIGLPLAYWLAETRWRLKFLIEAAVALPIILPPTVLGFYILIAIGPQSPFGQGYEALVGRQLPFSFEGLLLASVIYSFPFAVRPFVAAFSGIERRLIEASWCLGVSHLRTFFRVVCPVSWPGILTGLVLAFAHTLGEFGVVLMVGGNIPGVTRTISIAIYDDVEALNYAQAANTSLLLLGVSFLALSVAYFRPLKGGAI